MSINDVIDVLKLLQLFAVWEHKINMAIYNEWNHKGL